MRWLLVFTFLLIASPAWADTAAGVAAYDRGDFETALRELKPAAENGDPVAQTKLGLMFVKGLGMERDAPAAVEWFRKAAAQGDPEGQYSLGVAYDIGDTGTKDPAQALLWYRKSAERGYAKAQYNLGHMLVNDPDPSGHVEGAGWVLKAAEQEHAGAMHLYGNLCGGGHGVSQNLLCARYWLARADAAGEARSKKILAITEDGIAEMEAAGVPKTSGGDGSTQERAILLPDAKDEIEGVKAEHIVVRAYFEDWKWQSQALINTPDLHIYDAIELSGPGGVTKTIYFDIHNWFGKMD